MYAHLNAKIHWNDLLDGLEQTALAEKHDQFSMNDVERIEDVARRLRRRLQRVDYYVCGCEKTGTDNPTHCEKHGEPRV